MANEDHLLDDETAEKLYRLTRSVIDRHINENFAISIIIVYRDKAQAISELDLNDLVTVVAELSEVVEFEKPEWMN